MSQNNRSRRVLTDGGAEMVQVCSDCGNIVDPDDDSHNHGSDNNESTGNSDESETEDAQDGSSDSSGQQNPSDQNQTESGSGNPNEESDARDEDAESSESDEQSTDDELSDEEVEDELNEMEDQSRGDSSAEEWYDTNDSSVDDTFADDEYDRLQDELADPETEMGKRQRERDDRDRARIPNEEICEKYEDQFAKDVADVFREIKTRERRKPATHGSTINVRGVIRRRAGDKTEDKLFKKGKPSEAGDRCITVVVDSSGSMSETQIKIALKGLADASDRIGDRFAATAFYTKGRGVSTTTETDLITAPNESFQDEHLDSFRADGKTPTGSGIKDGRGLSEYMPNNEEVIIVVTDGEANISMDDTSGSNPKEDAADQVETARSQNKRVIGIGVGRSVSEGYMEEIFGDGGYITTEMENITDILLEVYKNQMDTVNQRR